MIHSAQELFSHIEKELPNFTASERQIAQFILNNRESLPFETAASIAEKLDITGVTVGRFCRTLGFKSFRDIKETLRDTLGLPWKAGSELGEFLSGAKDADKRRATYERECELLSAVYERTQHKAWTDSVALLANSRVVQVAGFQSGRGISAFLAHQLSAIRPSVFQVDEGSGNFADVLLEQDADRCLVIVDQRRYSRHAQLLAQKAHEAGISLIVIGDSSCEWAGRFTYNLLVADAGGELFLHSSVATMGLINLLLNDVVLHGEAGEIEQRMARIGDLYEDFVGFSRPVRSRRGSA